MLFKRNLIIKEQRGKFDFFYKTNISTWFEHLQEAKLFILYF